MTLEQLSLVVSVAEVTDEVLDAAFHLPGDPEVLRCRARLEVADPAAHDPAGSRKVVLTFQKPAAPFREQVMNYLNERLGHCQ